MEVGLTFRLLKCWKLLTNLDLLDRNLAFTMPHLGNLPESEFIEALGQPEIGNVRRTDGEPPEY